MKLTVIYIKNNYKAHDVVHDIKNIDPIPKSAAVAGPEPTATEIGKGLKYNISEACEKVNGFKDLGADAFKTSTQTANAERFGVDRGVVNATSVWRNFIGRKDYV